MANFKHISFEDLDEKQLDPDDIALDSEDNDEYTPVSTKIVHSEEEAEELGDMVTEADSVAESMESLANYIVTLESIRDRGGLDQNGAMLLNATLPMIHRSVGMGAYKEYSLESFRGVSQRQTSTTIALEGLGDVFYEIVKAFRKFIKWIIERVTTFYKSFFDDLTKVEGRIKKIKKNAESKEYEYKDEISGLLRERLGTELAKDGKVQDIPSALSNILTVVRKGSNDAILLHSRYKKLADGNKELSSHVKSFISEYKGAGDDNSDKDVKDARKKAIDDLYQNLAKDHKEMVEVLTPGFINGDNYRDRLQNTDKDRVIKFKETGFNYFAVFVMHSKDNQNKLNSESLYLDFAYTQLKDSKTLKFSEDDLPQDDSEVLTHIKLMEDIVDSIKANIKESKDILKKMDYDFQEIAKILEDTKNKDMAKEITKPVSDILSFAKTYSSYVTKVDVKVQNHMLRLLRLICDVIDSCMTKSED